MRRLNVTMQDETGAQYTVPRWRLWSAVLGTPLLVAALILGGWHLVDDHTLLHALVGAFQQQAQQVQKLGDPETTKTQLADLTKRVDELTKRVDALPH